MKMPGIAQLVIDAVERGGKSDYVLHAWVVMPNHVHLWVTPAVGNPVRAGLVECASQYRWSSAGWATGGSPADQGVRPTQNSNL